MEQDCRHGTKPFCSNRSMGHFFCKISSERDSMGALRHKELEGGSGQSDAVGQFLMTCLSFEKYFDVPSCAQPAATMPHCTEPSNPANLCDPHTGNENHDTGANALSASPTETPHRDDRSVASPAPAPYCLLQSAHTNTHRSVLPPRASVDSFRREIEHRGIQVSLRIDWCGQATALSTHLAGFGDLAEFGGPWGVCFLVRLIPGA